MDEIARHSVSVTGVIVDEKRRALLIQRRDNGRWEPPGGVLEIDETIEDGAAREVLEETGMKVEIEQLTGIYKNMKLGVVALVFRARAISGEPQTGPETRDTRWATAAEVADLVPEVYAVRVQDAMAANDQPVIRHHDGVRLL